MMAWQWYYYRIKYVCMSKLWKENALQRCMKAAGRSYLTQQEANERIGTQLKSGLPFLACRLGTGEAFAMRTFHFGHARNKQKVTKQLCDCAGFFPPQEEYMERFAGQMEQDLQQADLFGTSYEPLVDYFIARCVPRGAGIMDIGSIVPITMEHPWSEQLAGKKVLVVHPFVQTIRKQYQKRQQLFENANMLPAFELITYQAVQTSAGAEDERFQNWFEALHFMEEEIQKLEYDVALLGCGAYGLPLAAWIKRQGRQAVHVGGGLQLLFGIKGRRWDSVAQVRTLYNEHWVYPSADETPKGASIVEAGCYWGGNGSETM